MSFAADLACRDDPFQEPLLLSVLRGTGPARYRRLTAPKHWALRVGAHWALSMPQRAARILPTDALICPEHLCTHMPHSCSPLESKLLGYTSRPAGVARVWCQGSVMCRLSGQFSDA